jgi:tetratricopeptide (TPR) repeat protein
VMLRSRWPAIHPDSQNGHRRLPPRVPSGEPCIGRVVTPAASLAARAALEEAVHLDPRSVLAWSQLATCYISDYKNRWNEAGEEEIGAGQDLVRRARDALAAADAIDPNMAQSRYAEGFIRCVEGRHQEGYEAMDRATKLDPNFTAAHAQKANQLVRLGRAKEALPIARHAIELAGPRDQSVGVFYWVLGRVHFVLKNYGEAIHWLQRSVDKRANLWFSGAFLVASYALAGRLEEAGEALRQFYNRGFGWYTPQRIAEIYDTELPNNHLVRHQELLRGMELAAAEFLATTDRSDPEIRAIGETSS